MHRLLPITLNRFGASLTLKIWTICFTATHIPLLALVGYVATGHRSDAVPILVTALVATVLGTAFCLVAVWRLLRPLKNLTRTVETYRQSGQITAVSVRRQDEVGIVANAVSTLIAELDATLKQLRRQATTDALTGLGNRRWLWDIGTSELQRAARENAPLCVIIFDLDHFKKINDEHGHDVGDQVLMATGAAIQHNTRPYDIAARIGGEEFCILLPRTEIAQAVAVAERLRLELVSKTIGPLSPGHLTASFGVYRGDPGNETLKVMMSAADRNLYAAKGSGRNAVHWEIAKAFAGEVVNR